MFVERPDPIRMQRSLILLRWTVAILIAIHGWYRFLTDGYVGFGSFLTQGGFPFGPWIAIAITAFEVLGTPLLALGRFVLPLALTYSFIYVMGIVLVHYPAGWFVVGGGRNGMEFSVLLIACLLLVAYANAPRRSSR